MRIEIPYFRSPRHRRPAQHPQRPPSTRTRRLWPL